MPFITKQQAARRAANIREQRIAYAEMRTRKGANAETIRYETGMTLSEVEAIMSRVFREDNDSLTYRVEMREQTA